MTSRPWIEYWLEHYFTYAEPVSESNPLAFGWCVYLEPFDY